MKKKDIITIAGNAGSGKSTTAKRVAKELGYTHYSAGDFMRNVAKERGVTLEKLQELAEEDPSIDHEVDKRNVEIGKKNNVVIDSRLAFHFIPESFKVFLSLNPTIAAKRILQDSKNNNRSEERAADTITAVQEKIKERMQSNIRRYKDLYNINYLDTDQFDLVIDTKDTPPKEVAEKIIKEFTQWRSN